MNSPRFLFLLGTILTVAASDGRAQVVPPFFSGAGTSFEPQIGIVNSGIVLDVQPVVSHDLKYVTINMQPQASRLLSLQSFTFQNGVSRGIVGLPQTAVPLVAKGSNRGVVLNNALPTSAEDIKRQADTWVLEREGMYRVAPAR
ncbi:MAG TPA: hypothetical protein VLJ39_07790 [Tepidisphaeraceae bacterium]|nr:hypothetical protein [Tepidisphaeraceae bacterium]